MELRHLRYFVAVANEQNFTRAAEVLNIAQPPLSRQIRQLEEELGAQLLDREARPLRLTEAGRLLYEHAVHVLAGVDQIRTMMRQLAGVGRRRFVIGFVGSTLYGLLPEVIRQFRAGAGQVEVSVIECSTVEQIAALKEGRIDVGFGRLRFEDPAIRRIVLAEEPLVAVVPADHPLALPGAPVRLADLLAEPLIVYPRPARPSYADQILGIFHDLGLQPEALLEVHELQTAIGLVAAHAGLSIVPESVQRLRRDDIAYLPIADSAARSPIMMIHRAGDISGELARLIEIGCELHARAGTPHA
ncbi:LysR family transcriptional regulator [Novosphingobium album (ex Liu et al. 2023)]|uniref:LysR substrate-binding domain-containing protein n=1 Tax=Novosphingobium album (ex Liu et al. 2023) TaxID=3031130 RepID=A0ABT5WPM7_9SPHN|nr:LysR family transcriptional regulator [Novosphingobium album (ex Liu et al. 2023)]MDE8652010.1 LysR substrate-binding domain-containing protein [Novosphingobium album (ex Liu et al. 2023)]